MSERDPAARLALLDAWKQRNPSEANVRQLYLATYQQLNRAADVFRISNEMLAADPDNMQALAAVCVFAARFERPAEPSAEDLRAADNAANRLLANLPRYFAAEAKPAPVRDEVWIAAQRQAEELAHAALRWIQLKREASH